MLQPLRWIVLLIVLGAVPSWASAEQVRYHFVPADGCGAMTQVPAGPDRTLGELKRVLGARPLPYPYAIRPTHIVTFRHPFSGKNVNIPLRLPPGEPRMEQRADRIIYTHGDYFVEVHFQTDGSVDLIYNSGFMRALPFN